jgi:hypothetical protein
MHISLLAIYNFRCWFSAVLGIRDISMDPDADPDTRIHTSDLRIRKRTSGARKHTDPDDGRIQNRMRTCDNNGSGNGSGRPKNIRIRIPNTGSLEFFRCLTSRFLYECEGVQYVCLEGLYLLRSGAWIDRPPAS